MSKAQLHELLAVESDLENVCKKVLQEGKDTFKKKVDHFEGWHRRNEMLRSDGNTPPAKPDEHKELVSTVRKKFDYVIKAVVRYYDAVLQKEATNQTAVADLTVDGKVIGENLPATFLLGLESKLKHVREVFDAVPTLPPGIAWEVDESQGQGVYRMKHPEKLERTQKVFKSQILVEPTEHHPAQIEKWDENEVIGHFIREKFSGMISPAEKSELLGRVDKLIRAVKKARQRANKAEVVKNRIGNKLFDYIMDAKL